MNNKYSKLLYISVIFVSFYFIIIAFDKYFIKHQFILSQFIISELFFIICLVVSSLTVFDKVASLKNIIANLPSLPKNYTLNICSLLFGLVGAYISLYWTKGQILKIISLLGSVFFIAGSIFVIISDFKRKW